MAFLNSLDSDLYLLQYLLLIANIANKIVSFYVFIDVIVSLRKYRKFKALKIILSVFINLQPFYLRQNKIFYRI